MAGRHGSHQSSALIRHCDVHANTLFSRKGDTDLVAKGGYACLHLHTLAHCGGKPDLCYLASASLAFMHVLVLTHVWVCSGINVGEPRSITQPDIWTLLYLSGIAVATYLLLQCMTMH